MEEEEEVKVELEDEEENEGAKRATSRCLDCSDTVNELPVTFAKTKSLPLWKNSPISSGNRRKDSFHGSSCSPTEKVQLDVFHSKIWNATIILYQRNT